MITSGIENAVATITIDDPERRNPLSNRELRDLCVALDAAAAEPDVRVIVITGGGDQAFSAGGDLSGGFVDAPLTGHTERGALADVLKAMRLAPQPIIGRINGVALGGGFGIAVACDITIAADDVRMGTPEIDLGLWPMMISTVLNTAMPRKALLSMMMTGEIIDAATALRYGLVTTVVNRRDLDETVSTVATNLIAKSSAALALGKRAFYAISDLDTDTALDVLHMGLTATAATEDGVEGVRAFVDKRAPVWKGR